MLDRVLEALKKQKLPLEQWELIVIDSWSDNPVSSSYDLSWHPNARILKAPKPGLTNARLHGFRNSTANILVFVDDDNVLNCDYLDQTLSVSLLHSNWGAWGGKIDGEFECNLPVWAKSHLYLLAVRDVMTTTVSIPGEAGTFPWGAGLTVRRHIMSFYHDELNKDHRRKKLDRTKKSLISAGDTDLVMTAHDIGYQTALMPSLRLTHLIPAQRLKFSYFLQMAEKMAESLTLLQGYRGIKQRKPTFAGRVYGQIISFSNGWRVWRLHCAAQKGRDRAIAALEMEES